MSQKVHPKIFKIKETKDWLSRGFYQKKLPYYLEEDYLIREFLGKKLKTSSVEVIEIERGVSVLKVIIKTARPALVIGRGGKAVEEMKGELEKILFKANKGRELPKKEIKIDILEIRNPWTSANLVSQWVCQQMEKMMPYRRAMKMSLSKAMDNKEIQGIKIEVSGRLNGKEIARREWLKEGRLPRQTMRAIIDYGFSEALCRFGVIGVKVWMYKGDNF